MDYNNFFPDGVPDWAVPILVALVWIGGLFRKFFNWIWERIKSIFTDYPVIKKDLSDIKQKLIQIEERQFEDQKTIGRIETLLEQVEPLCNKINSYFAKHNE